MRVVSVNVGQSRDIPWDGGFVPTGIYKEPVAGRTAVGRLSLEGDIQVDLAVHGGPRQAVYGYPIEHYDFWRGLMPTTALEHGAFGENLTLEGLSEEDVHSGDILRVGTAELVVTQPRQPCFKLATKLGRPEIIREMLESGTSGFYFAVATVGDIGAGDTVEIVARDPQAVSIGDLNRLHRRATDDVALMRRALLVDTLSDGWRRRLTARIAEIEGPA